MQAILIQQSPDDAKKQSVSLTHTDVGSIEENEVLVRVLYSTLNYKDALAITGKGPVVRKFPMVPGIDFSGIVESAGHSDFKVGDLVVANGWGMGEVRWGGLAQYARVPANHLLKVPDGMSAKEAMSIGTAGYTAMLCVFALEDNGVQSGRGEVLVTGANGGVGSYAVSILAARGHNVCAATGRLDQAARLESLGARSVVSRDDFSTPGRALGKERWSGVVDSLGSHTLANACATTSYGGVVAACGMAQGLDFPGSVAPFILRGIKLIGIDSVYASVAVRQRAWTELARIPAHVHEQMVDEIGLAGVIDAAHKLMSGKVKGRIVVDVNA